MTIPEYEALTGLTVTNTALVTAQIARTKTILEMLLGYSLDTDALNDNEYVEIGKTNDGCSCPDINMDELLPADSIVYAYRLFPFNRADEMLAIDPASAVHKVKLVQDGVTLKTFEAGEYRCDFKRGITQYLERNNYWCTCAGFDCYCSQLAVDATWVIPAPILSMWADMVTFYSDERRDIKSETLGSHSYTKQTKSAPQELDENQAMIALYAGPNGTAFPIPTV